MGGRHLLVTNDFPPKVGGIQSYLWELWRRLDPKRFAVLTTSHPAAPEFDRSQPYRIERVPETQMWPTRALAARVQQLADEIGAGLVVLDPVLPLGLIGRRLAVPYAVVVHGAEVTVPGRLPVSHGLMAGVLRHAVHVVAAGGYPEAEARRVAGRGMPTATVVPPGVDTERFRPLDDQERRRERERFGVGADGPLVVSVSRLVPRKGMDVLIEASARLSPSMPGLEVLIAGRGRDADRLQKLIDRHLAPVRLLGEVSDEDLPGLLGCGDVFAMLCRNRWMGLEQEGFGIVFLEAGACAIPAVAGASGGAAEAVDHATTGLVVNAPRDAGRVASALRTLLENPGVGREMGRAARARAVGEFSYDRLARRLGAALEALGG